MTDDCSSGPAQDVVASTNLRLIEAMHDLGTLWDVAEGTMLFQQGDPADCIYTVLSGRLEVSILSEAGRKSVLDILSANQIFGELSLLSGATRTATVSALEKSRVLRIGREPLMQAMTRTPTLAIWLLQLVISRERWISKQLETLTFEPLEVRLARRLLYLKGVIGEPDGRIAVSQHALGAHAGATREAVSKILGTWKSMQIIEIYRGGIAIRRPDLLAQRAEDDFS